MVEKKPKSKVYINIRKALRDYNKGKDKLFTRVDVATFIFPDKKMNSETLRVKLARKILEDSKYELTLTEACNIALFFDMGLDEFILKYTKAI